MDKHYAVDNAEALMQFLLMTFSHMWLSSF